MATRVKKAAATAEAKSEFHAHLDTFKKSMATLKASMLACSQLALKHFQQHGDLSQVQEFHDAMLEHGKNVTRINALKAWLRDNAPITMEGGRFIKRKGLDAEEEKAAWNMARAMEKPFWDYLPDTEVFVWEIKDVFTALEQTVNRFTKDSEARKAASEEDKKKLDEVVRIVHAMAKGQRVAVMVDVSSLPTPEEEKAAAAAAKAAETEAGVAEAIAKVA